jgi:hypothetical protein
MSETKEPTTYKCPGTFKNGETIKCGAIATLHIGCMEKPTYHFCERHGREFLAVAGRVCSAGWREMSLASCR